MSYNEFTENRIKLLEDSLVNLMNQLRVLNERHNKDVETIAELSKSPWVSCDDANPENEEYNDRFIVKDKDGRPFIGYPSGTIDPGIGVDFNHWITDGCINLDIVEWMRFPGDVDTRFVIGEPDET